MDSPATHPNQLDLFSSVPPDRVTAEEVRENRYPASNPPAVEFVNGILVEAAKAEAFKDPTVLAEAGQAVDGDRGRFYGHPADNHGNTAAFWTEYIERKYGLVVALTARDVCMLMVLLKVSRDANRPKRDNLVDICGYARNAEMIEDRLNE